MSIRNYLQFPYILCIIITDVDIKQSWYKKWCLHFKYPVCSFSCQTFLQLILTVQCVACENQCSNKRFWLISLKVKLLSKLWGLGMFFCIILKSSFLFAWIRNGLNCSKIVSTALYDSMPAYNWGFTSILQTKLISYSSFQLSGLLCFNADLQFCDQNSLVQKNTWPTLTDQMTAETVDSEAILTMHRF